MTTQWGQISTKVERVAVKLICDEIDKSSTLEQLEGALAFQKAADVLTNQSYEVVRQAYETKKQQLKKENK